MQNIGNKIQRKVIHVKVSKEFHMMVQMLATSKKSTMTEIILDALQEQYPALKKTLGGFLRDIFPATFNYDADVLKTILKQKESEERLRKTFGPSCKKC